MKLMKLAISNSAPNIRDCAWLKPVEDGVALYVPEGGTWKPLKVVDDAGTAPIADDKSKTTPVVTNIKNLTVKQCNALNVGDQIIKKTGSGNNLEKHLYTVTYKSDKKGEMCLNYFGRFNVEEVYYDKTGASSDWAWKETNITDFSSLISG